jgi:agmatinase
MVKGQCLLEIYQILLKIHGPQGWWPLAGMAGSNPTSTGTLRGYHPGDYSYPHSREEQFEICLGSILTQNTAWPNVEKALQQLRENNLLDPSRIITCPGQHLANIIRPSGYFNQKAKKIKIFSQYFLQLQGNPQREELLNLWGIGPETADSMLLYAFQSPHFVVDAYTRRIFTHLKIFSPRDDYHRIKNIFEARLPHDIPLFQEYHALIVEHAKQYYFKRPYGDCPLAGWLKKSKKKNKKDKIMSSTLKGLVKPKRYFDSTQTTPEILSNYVHIVGFPFDGTACFRKGTRLGPDALREVTKDIETYSPYLNADTTEKKIIDLGNLPLGKDKNAAKQWQKGTDFFTAMIQGRKLLAENIKILTLGGEHSISYAPIKAFLQECNDLVVLHLDAHADLRDGYEGHHYSHASIIFRILEYFGPQHRLIQYGIRSGTKQEFEWMRENQTHIITRPHLFDIVEKLHEERPIYLTLDLDFFDPAFLPGTGTPEAGGEDFHFFTQLIQLLNRKRLVGADIVELAPNLDATGNSTVFAAKVAREILLSLA